MGRTDGGSPGRRCGRLSPTALGGSCLAAFLLCPSAAAGDDRRRDPGHADRTYDPNRPFGAWLAAIARYKWIDVLRSLENIPKDILDDDIAIPGHEETVMSARSLERLLSNLKPAQSEAIRLVKLEGLSIEEASKATGQSTALLRANIHRGLKRPTSLLRSQRTTLIVDTRGIRKVARDIRGRPR